MTKITEALLADVGFVEVCELHMSWLSVVCFCVLACKILFYSLELITCWELGTCSGLIQHFPAY